MADEIANESGIAQGAEPNAESNRRSFIAKASAGGVVGLGAILGMTQGCATGVARGRGDNASQASDPESRIMNRALTESEYRRRLIADPRAVIGEEVGAALPANVQFRVVEETPDTVYLVLPYLPPVARNRVSPGDLQQGAVGMAFTRSWFRSCPCRCSSLSVCGRAD
jgi:hypothetical protein